MIEGNFIGTNPAGTGPGRPAGYGILVEGRSSGNRIGGETPASRNLIAGNLDTGVVLTLGTEGNLVEGNLLGTDRSGTENLGGLKVGVLVSLDGFQAAGNWIEGNTIACVWKGVYVLKGNGARILGNSIFAVEQAIELYPSEGPNPNDPGDADGGGNLSQNYPEITSAKANDQRTVVVGTLDSTPNTTFVVQFFANPADDPAAAKTLLATETVTTDANGQAPFAFDLKPVPRGRTITATATDNPSSSTSELSPPVTVKRL